MIAALLLAALALPTSVPPSQPLIGPAARPAFNAAPGLPNIPSEFDPKLGLASSWYKTDANPSGVAPKSSPEEGFLGALRFVCGPGQLLADDPIVYPGQPGKSHLHQFYGNLDGNAYSTYESLRKHGKSTCNWVDPVEVKDPVTGVVKTIVPTLNRSLYWMPAMLDGHGNVVRPDHEVVYYKAEAADSFGCTRPDKTGICTSIPNGLRFVGGWNPVTHQGAQPNFLCDGPTKITGNKFHTLPEVAADCPFDPAPGATQSRIGMQVDMPPCWDGKNLDSPDHRSHMGFIIDTHSFGFKCDAKHPFLVPQFSTSAWFTVDANAADWRLASDAMEPDQPHGYTLHADWFGAWDNTAEKTWIDHCIDEARSASGGNLCDGTQLPGAARGGDPDKGSPSAAKPRLVPLASIPGMTGAMPAH